MGVWVISCFRRNIIKGSQEGKYFAQKSYGNTTRLKILNTIKKKSVSFQVYFQAKQELIRQIDKRSKIFSKWLKIEYVVVWGILSLYNFNLEIWIKTLMGVWVISSFRWKMIKGSQEVKNFLKVAQNRVCCSLGCT